jgi:hypothetical protein
LSFAGRSDDEAANKIIKMQLRRMLDPTEHTNKPVSTQSLPCFATNGEESSVSLVGATSRTTAATADSSVEQCFFRHV